MITRWLFFKIILQLRRNLKCNMHATNKSLKINYIKYYTFKFLYTRIKTRTVTRFECVIKAFAGFEPRSAPYRNNISSTRSSWKYPSKREGGVDERRRSGGEEKPKHSALFAMLCSGHMREYLDASEGLFRRIRSI